MGFDRRTTGRRALAHIRGRESAQIASLSESDRQARFIGWLATLMGLGLMLFGGTFTLLSGG